MKLDFFKKLSWLLIFPLFLFSCEDDDKNYPRPDFTANQLSTVDVTIQFTDLTAEGVTEWYWEFPGGTPNSSTERNPTVTYYDLGNFDVRLTSGNSDGSRTLTLYNYINVARFENPTWTDIDITVNGITKTFPIDTYVQFAAINTTNLSYYAQAKGTTGSGDVIGRTVFWEGIATIGTYNTWYLDIGDDLIYYSVTNNGPDNLTPFVVDVGMETEETENIVIPTGGREYGTGYFLAYDDMIVRTYFESDQNRYFEWQEGAEFDIPWVINQAVNLITGTSKGESSYKAKSRKVSERSGVSVLPSGSR